MWVEALGGKFKEIFGEDCWDDSPEATARRVMKFWAEFKPQDLIDFTPTTFLATAQQMILVKNIEFASLCSHHLLPFFGVAHVAYLPHKLMIGVSKIPRIVQFYAKRPQVQEKMTDEIATWMQRILEPKGTAVLVVAKHTCMACRGVTARNSDMITSEMRGVFLTAEAARLEFLQLAGVR